MVREAPMRLPLPPAIEAITRLTDLEVLADNFLAENSYAPEQISHWDPKPQFGLQISAYLLSADDRPPQSLVDYTYSGYVDIEDQVRERLRESSDRALLLTPSGTTSIANAIAYLANIGCQKLEIVAPYYFAVEALAESFKIPATFSSVTRFEEQYHLPSPQPSSGLSAVWLTLPVYGASAYISPDEIARYIDGISESTIVVVDEGLAFCDRPSLVHVTSMARVIRIITPHKAICANGEKVSFLSFPKHLADGFDSWSECFAGGIGTGGARALKLIGSPKFDAAVAGIRMLLADRKDRLHKLISERSSISLDRNTDGHFVTLYWPDLKMSIGDDIAEMRSLLNESGCIVMPSSRNKHPADYGFAFRVNLLRLDDAGLGGLSRLAEALDRRL
jgi:histidinol-phosphate/aromatic aminotransferase/cobyric acid decarboxylase-like protein